MDRLPLWPTLSRSYIFLVDNIVVVESTTGKGTSTFVTIDETGTGEGAPGFVAVDKATTASCALASFVAAEEAGIT